MDWRKPTTSSLNLKPGEHRPVIMLWDEHTSLTPPYRVKHGSVWLREDGRLIWLNHVHLSQVPGPDWYCELHSPHEQAQDMWQHDHIQFARMLSEMDMIGAIGLDSPWWAEFQRSTDLEPHEVRELLDRAHEAFDRYKKEILTA